MGSAFLIPEMQMRHEEGPEPRLRLAKRASLVRLPTEAVLAESNP